MNEYLLWGIYFFVVIIAMLLSIIIYKLPKKMKQANPVDYWYQKYLKARQELTWEDIMFIDVLLHNVSDEKCTISTIDYYKEVLRRFNEAKK